MNWGNNYYFTQLNKFDLQGNKISSKKTNAAGRFFNDSVCGAVYGSGDTLGFAKGYLIPDTLIRTTKFYLYNFVFRNLITVGNNKIVACGKAENGFSGYFGFLAVAVDTSFVGLEEVLEIETIKVFPNPSKNEIYFKIESSLFSKSKNLTLKLFDSVSKQVFSMSIHSSQTRLKTENFKNGEYVYVLFNEKIKIASGKIIINKN
jgi:hypothetical protein